MVDCSVQHSLMAVVLERMKVVVMMLVVDLVIELV